MHDSLVLPTDTRPTDTRLQVRLSAIEESYVLPVGAVGESL